MSETLTIGFALSGVDKVASAFTQFAKMADAGANRMTALTASLGLAATAQRTLNAEIEKFNRLTGGSGSAAVNIGRGLAPAGGGSARTPAASRFTSGPFQRQEQLAEQMGRATLQGNGRAQADIGLAQGRNEKSIERALAGPKGFGDKLADVLKTSRFGAEGLQPLVGKTLGLAAEALGPELAAVAGPVGLVVVAATEAAKAIFELAKSSAEAGAAYAKFSYSIGNNGAGAAGALSVGRMAGLDAGGTASLADSLNSAITGSAMGHIYGYRVGVMNQAGPWGNVKHADNLVKAIEGLRGIKDFSERVRATNALGLQGASAAIMMPQKQYDLGKQDAAITGGIMGQDFQEKSLAFQGALGRVGTAFDNLMTVLGKPALGAITNVLNNVADGLNNFAVFLNSPAMQTALQVLGALTPAGALALATRPDDPHAAALDRNTAALNNMAGRYNQPGVYGRDTDGRLGRAFPAGLGYGGDSTGDAFRGYSQRRREYMASGYALSAF